MGGSILPTDNFDRMVELLQDIRNLLDGQDSGSQTRMAGLRPLGNDYLIIETDNLPDSETTAAGEVELQPGETAAVVRYRVPADAVAAVLSLGATDRADVEYWLEVDDDSLVGGKTNSPLGTVNDPFSFVDDIQGFVPANRVVEYMVRLDENASSSTTLVGRIHLLKR